MKKTKTRPKVFLQAHESPKVNIFTTRNNIPMDPNIGRVAFNLGVVLVVLALIPLPFLDVNSAEFIIDILTIIISFAFLMCLSYEIRRQVKTSKVKERA